MATRRSLQEHTKQGVKEKKTSHFRPGSPSGCEKWSTPCPMRPLPPNSGASESSTTRYLPPSGTPTCYASTGACKVEWSRRACITQVACKARTGAWQCCNRISDAHMYFCRPHLFRMERRQEVWMAPEAGGMYTGAHLVALVGFRRREVHHKDERPPLRHDDLMRNPQGT